MFRLLNCWNGRGKREVTCRHVGVTEKGNGEIVGKKVTLE